MAACAFVLVLLCTHIQQVMAAVGGFGAEKTDADTLALFSTPKVLAAVNAALGKSYAALKAVSYKSQVVRALRCATSCLK